MSLRRPRYPKEELARLGREIYESQVRLTVESGNQGRVVAIDVETGAYEIADDSMVAAETLLKRCPDAQILGIRIGYPTVHRFGFRPLKMLK
jgi:hypothetical protein